MKQDFIDFLLCFDKYNVDFLIVGAQAMSTFGYTRASGNLDIFTRVSEDNSKRVFYGLQEFGAPLLAHKVTPELFQETGSNYQIGIPPSRIDILTKIDGLDYDEAAASRVINSLGGLKLPALSLDALIKNKIASGREKDLLDVQELRILSQFQKKE